MTRTIGVCAALMALGGGVAFGCGGLDASLGGDKIQEPREDGDASAGTLDPNAAGSPPNGPADNAIILVHAAKSQAFRLCFAKELDRRPQPDSQIMPEANVVGVEVGSTVRLGPLAGAPGEVFLFDEPSIRAFYPQFGGAGAGPTCGNLLSASNPLSKSAVSLGTIDKNLHTGVHLLVLRGCPGDGPLRKYSVAECGATWTAATGNLGVKEIELSGAARPQSGTLPAQVVNLSQPLESGRAGSDVVITFGDLMIPDAKHASVTTNPLLFGGAAPAQPAQLQYPADDPAIFASTGFRVSLQPKTGAATIVLDSTLERIQELSAPRDVPPAYFSAASNYALLLLGDPDAKLGDGGIDPDDRQRLHFVAIPVVEPRGDAGTSDGGDPEDAGAAPPNP